MLTLAAGPLRRRWYRIGPALAILGGLWACAPDADHLLKLLPWVNSSMIAKLETTHADSLLWNVFFFHGWLDRHYAGHGTITGLAWLIVLFGAFFWLLTRRVGKLEDMLAEGSTCPGQSRRKGPKS